MSHAISIALITKNEEASLRRTLLSVRWASEIVIVDNGSTDRTEAIAREFGAKFYAEEWKGFSAQKNSAIAKCSCDWVLSLDADEEVSAELAEEIRALLAGSPAHDAYFIPRRNFFLGRWIRHGGYYPDPKLRLFRRGAARFEDRAVHESMEAKGPVGRLKGHLIHHCYPTLDEYIEHMNRYSSAGAQMLVDSGRAGSSWAWLIWNAMLDPAVTFLYNYIFRLGFLDGRAGLLQHINHSAYIHWKFAKAWHGARRGGQAEV